MDGHNGLKRGSRRYQTVEHHSVKMAASRLVRDVGLLLLSSFALTSAQGMPRPRPPWTWKNGGALSPTMRQHSSAFTNEALSQPGFMMSGAPNPMALHSALAPGRTSSSRQYLAANRNARTRTEGEKTVTKQSPSHGEIHKGNLLTVIANSSLSNTGKSLTSEMHNKSRYTSSQRSLDTEAAISNREDANSEVEGISERLQKIPDADKMTERDASALTTKLSDSRVNENQSSRSESTGTSKVTHFYPDDPHASPSPSNPSSTRSTATEEDNSSTNAKKSSDHDVKLQKIASLVGAEHPSLDYDHHRMRRSLQATSPYRNKPGISPYSARKSLRRLPGNNVDKTAYRFGSGPAGHRVSTTAEDFSEILTRLHQISQEFVDVYQEIVSHYAPDFKAPQEIPSLEQELSRSEDIDYFTEAGLVSDIQYAVAKGKHLIELYHQNLNELRLLSLKAIALSDYSSETLDDTQRTVPSVRIMFDEPSSQELELRDLDIDVGSRINGGVHSGTVTITTTDFESSSAFTGRAENENTGWQHNAHDSILLLQKTDKDVKSQDTAEPSLRIDDDTVLNDKKKLDLINGTEDFKLRTSQQTNASMLIDDTVMDRSHKHAENDNQTLESRSNSDELQNRYFDTENKLAESHSSDEGSGKEDLGTRGLQQTTTSKSTPVSDNNSLFNIAETDSVTSFIHERRLNTNAPRVKISDSGETEIAGSRQGESERNKGKSVVSSQLAENTSRERKIGAAISSTLVKDQAINAGQQTDADGSAVASKSMEAHTETKISRNKGTNGTYQLVDSSPAGYRSYIDQGTIADKLRGRANIGRTALQNEGNMGQSSRGYPEGSKIGGRTYVGNTDARAAFPRVKGVPAFPDRKFIATGANGPVAHPSLAASYPNWMVRGRRSVGQETAEPPPRSDADEVPVTRSQVTDETQNNGNSSDRPVERIETISTDDDVSTMIRNLGHSATNKQERKNTETDLSQRDSTDNEDKGNSLLPRFLDESVVERDDASKIDTSYIKLLDNIEASTILASNIKDLFERVATISHQIQLQGSDFAGNKGIDNTLYFEKKAKASVKHLLSKYSIDLSDILESTVAEDTDTVVSRALSVYYLARHRLLNYLLLKNVAHMAKRLNETKTRQQPFMASRIAPGLSGVNLSPYHGALSASPKMGDLSHKQLTSNPLAISNRQSKGSKDVSSRNDLEMFITVEDIIDNEGSAVSVEMLLFPEEEETLDPETYLLPPTLPEYGTFGSQIESEAIDNSSTIAPSPVASKSNMDLNETVKTHNAAQSQRQILYLANNSTQHSKSLHSTGRRKPQQTINLQHQASVYFSGEGSPQQTMKLQTQEPLSTYNTQKYQTLIQPQIQEQFLDYSSPQHLAPQNVPGPETAQNTIRPQTQQPFSTYNTQKYQIPIQTQIQQQFHDYNSPQRLISQNFPEQETPQQIIIPQTQQPFSTYNTQKYQTPIQPQFLGPNSPQHLASVNSPGQETSQLANKLQTQQPFYTYNTQKYQTPIQQQTQQLFLDHYSPQYLTSQNFPGRETPQQATQLQIQQPFSAYNSPRHQSPIQSQIQQGFFN